MKHLFHSLILLLLSFGLVQAQLPAAGKTQNQTIIIQGGTAHLGTGKTIENSVIVIKNGKIAEIGDQSINADTKDALLIDAKGKDIYPGFIVANSTVGIQEIAAVRATDDRREQGALNPNVRTGISYSTDSELIPTFRFNGVLLAQVVPKGGIISGTSSVMQMDGWNWEDAALKMDDGIHLNFPNKTQYYWDYQTSSVKTRPNKNYDKIIQSLEDLFNDAQVYDKTTPNLKLQAVQGLFDGTQNLYIHTGSAKGIITSVNFAKKMNVKKIVLVGADEAESVKEFIKSNNIPVLLKDAHQLPNYSQSSVDEFYKLPASLTKAGIKVGISFSGGMNANARNLAFLAGNTVAYGLSKEEALQLITANAAEILGISERVGTLEVGKDATLFISKGDALDMRGNQLEKAWIQGKEINLEDALQQRLYKKYKEKYNKK
jgi:imidazolonepropionase-like amidohydrolase